MTTDIPALPGVTPDADIVKMACDSVSLGDERFTLWARREASRWTHLLTAHATSDPTTFIISALPQNPMGIEC